MRRLIAVFAVITLAACSTNVDAGGGDGGSRGKIEVAKGTTVDLDTCPSGWSDTGGITDKEIRIGISLPKSGSMASVGAMADGEQAYFDHVNDSDPIDGKKLVLVQRDDAYNPARTRTNVQEMLAGDNLFAFNYVVGTAHNLGVQPLIEESCTPHLMAGTGDPRINDPARHPWTIGGMFSQRSEALIWCDYIKNTIGAGKSVAALYMDNDFGSNYAKGVGACAERGEVKLAASVKHAPDAPGITNQLTTLAASKADVVLLGTTGAFCPQALAGIAASSWKPVVIMSLTCAQIALTFQPTDPDGSGTRVVLDRKDGDDDTFKDDRPFQDVVKILQEAGLDVSGRPLDGVLLGMYVERTLRKALTMPGGLTRVNVLKAMWNSDVAVPVSLDGIRFRTSGVDDAFLMESARIATYVPPKDGAKAGHFTFSGDLLSIEGQSGRQ
ncbi:ABC transporter substrate-binding protein [Nonomuraea purpurea]|uniref:ABC transporter substrate-binding protein n=1 Tax=Nonomuraea purpurea TaxID=1849276 RepID=A0ABV8FYY7_9ACTN